MHYHHHTSHSSKIPIVTVCQDIIHRIREAFNKEFDDVYEKKQQEMAKIKEKNKRIRKIHMDLRLPDTIVDPEFGDIERPELLLIVQDDEVWMDALSIVIIIIGSVAQ